MPISDTLAPADLRSEVAAAQLITEAVAPALAWVADVLRRAEGSAVVTSDVSDAELGELVERRLADSGCSALGQAVTDLRSTLVVDVPLERVEMR